MSVGVRRPTVVAMDDRRLLRIAALAAFLGAAAQLVASVLEPDWGGDPGEAVRVVSDNGLWVGDRLLDLVGVFLAVGAFTVVGHTLAEDPGRQWARAGQPFLVLMGALGAAGIVSAAVMKDIADTWAETPPEAKQSYLASFDATSTATEDLMWVALLALGLYLTVLAAAILSGSVYARWIGWTSAISALLLLGGELLELVVEEAFVAVLAGFVLCMTVLVALGVSMWRQRKSPSARAWASSTSALRSAPLSTEPTSSSLLSKRRWSATHKGEGNR